MSQAEMAARFRRLHDSPPKPLVLPNAWDAASARMIEEVGAPAIATTSAGVSWALGRGDGQRLERGEMIEMVRRIVATVAVPVTADVEGGYGEGTPDDVAATVRAAIEAGAAGINLEDALGGRLLPPERQAERIRAARAAAEKAGADLFLNARTDVYILGPGTPEETLRRAEIYRAAGADCLFVPRLVDPEAIAALVPRLGLPLNIMAGPGAPTVAELARLGVARVSVGPAIALAALEATRRATRELLERGTYGGLDGALPYREANALFVRGD